jgi:hypothetical protein
MSTGIYIRVSSPKGQKTDSQRAELEAWLKRHRHKAVQWFEDRDSATNMQRDAFQRLQAAIFAGKITTVVVWKLDRLARNLKEGVNVLADWCKRGVRVIAVTQQIDLSGPVGHLIASLLFGIAEIELGACEGAAGYRYRPCPQARHLRRKAVRHHQSRAVARPCLEETGPHRYRNREGARCEGTDGL